jgi:hypothetical protein
MAAKITLKIEGMIMGIPNNNPMNSEPNNAGTSSAKNPKTVRRLIPNIDNTKCLLLIENIPPAKPNAKTKIPKIPMNTPSKPTAINKSPVKAAKQEAMIVRMLAAIGKPVLSLGGGGGGG